MGGHLNKCSKFHFLCHGFFLWKHKSGSFIVLMFLYHYESPLCSAILLLYQDPSFVSQQFWTARIVLLIIQNSPKKKHSQYLVKLNVWHSEWHPLPYCDVITAGETVKKNGGIISYGAKKKYSKSTNEAKACVSGISKESFPIIMA